MWDGYETLHDFISFTMKSYTGCVEDLWIMRLFYKFKNRLLKIMGIVMWILLVPILIVNVTLIVNGYVNEDEVASIGGYIPLIVLTDSMSPAIDSGDLIICREIDNKIIGVGDVISYFDPTSTNHSVVTHRVVEVIVEDNQHLYRTRGDNNNIEDQVLIPEENVVGLYRYRLIGLGSVALFMQSTSGLLVIALLILLWGVYEVIAYKQGERKKDMEIESLQMELESLKARGGD